MCIIKRSFASPLRQFVLQWRGGTAACVYGGRPAQERERDEMKVQRKSHFRWLDRSRGASTATPKLPPGQSTGWRLCNIGCVPTSNCTKTLSAKLFPLGPPCMITFLSTFLYPLPSSPFYDRHRHVFSAVHLRRECSISCLNRNTIVA